MKNKIIDYILFSGLTAGIGFLTVVYMTKNISVEAFGIIGLFMAILYILPQVISFSSIGLVSINKVKLDTQDFMKFSQSYFTFGLIIFIGTFIISLFVSGMFQEYFMLFLLLPIIAFIQYFGMFHNAELVQEGKSRRFGIYRLILSLLSMVLTVISIHYFNLAWDGRLYAILGSEVIVLLITLQYSFKTLRKYKPQFNKLKFKEYFFFGLPLFLGLGAGWFLNQADRFIVLHFFSLKEVGVYTLAYSIGTIVNIINQAVTNAIVPNLYQKLKEKSGYTVVKKLNIYYSLTILAIALAIGLTSFWYIPLFFNDDYLQSPLIILFIALAFAFNGIYRVSGSVIAFYKKNTLQMKLLYLSALANLVLSILLIPLFGLLSPAISTLFAYILLSYLSYRYGWKILRKEERC